MNMLVQELDRKIKEIRNQINLAEKYVSGKKQGDIRISRKGNINQYYLKNEKICKYLVNGKYLKKEEQHIAFEIIQRDYCDEFLKVAKEQLYELSKVRELLMKDKLTQSYKNQNDYRKEIITPIVLPDDEYVHMWEAEKYEGKKFSDGIPEYYTNKGERVRSKSEKIIADYLYSCNIPYKYEKPLKLFTKMGTEIFVFSDFTLLDVANRREIYYEHLGKMDDPEYAESAVRKIETYEYNGIYPGDRLLLTYETAKNPLDTKIMQKLIKNVFG